MRFFGFGSDEVHLSLLDRAQLGAPREFGPLTMVPIFLSPNDGGTREYDLLHDALLSGTVRVTELSESGSVPMLAVRNAGPRAVFLMDGEELIGAKQNRIVNLSILVPAKTTLPIPVACVERGRWSYRRSDFGASPNTMFAAGRAMQMSCVSQRYRTSGQPQSDQRQIWDAVLMRMNEVGASSDTEAMHDVYEAKRMALGDMLAGLSPCPGQHGAMFAVGGEIVGMDLFEFPDVFAAYMQKIARGYALDALVRRDRRTFAPGEADRFLATVKEASRTRFRGVGMGTDVRLEGPGLAGSALVLGHRTVHLAAFRLPA